MVKQIQSGALRPRNLLGIALSAWLLAGCSHTEQVDYGSGDSFRGQFVRQVESRTDLGLATNPPSCAVLLPIQRAGLPETRALRIEEAAARHLSGRLPRVIGPYERQALLKDGIFSLATPYDQLAFLLGTGCDALIDIEITASDTLSLVVWSRTSLGMDIRLHRPGGDEPDLWRARHLAKRSEGGVPFSPLGVSLSFFEAKTFEDDDDVFPSMVDDVLRRLVETLPDLRPRS